MTGTQFGGGATVEPDRPVRSATLEASMSSRASLPSIPVSLVRATAPWKRSASATTVLPDAHQEVVGWVPEANRLESYRQVVTSTAQVPIAFPQVAVMALHLDLISALSFPVRAMGLIHLASEVEVLGELPVDAPWTVRAWVSPGRHVRSGLEFDLCGEVLVGRETVWTSRAVTLSRSRKAGGAEQSTVPEVSPPERSEQWRPAEPVRVEEGTGRSFGRVTGDVNPIHLHALSAKVFGFKSAIAHGWWTTGRIAAMLDADRAEPGRRMRIVFRRPVYLPSTPELLARAVSDLAAAEGGTITGQRFALVDARSSTGTPDDALKVLVYGDVTAGAAKD
jgi:acyl dehydratase